MTKVFEVVAWDDLSNLNQILLHSCLGHFPSRIEFSDDCTTETFKV